MQLQISTDARQNHLSSAERIPRSVPVMVVVVVGLLLSLPCFRFGLPADQDGVYHIDYQTNFTSQFWSGDLYPRWLATMNGGLGTPIFYLQYPAPYFAAALISAVLPEADGQRKAALDLGFIAALATIGSGLAAWYWLRTMLSSWAAAAGAVAYMVLPYHLAVDLYSRAAIGEYCAFLWLPVCMLFAARIGEGQRSAVPWFALSTALLLMTHLFTGLLFLPVPLLWSWFHCSREDRRSCVVRLGAATVLAFALAAVYLFPLAQHKQWFDHRMLETDGTNNYNYRNHFGLFTEPFLRYAAGLGQRLGAGPALLNLVAAAMAVLCILSAALTRIALGAPIRRALIVSGVAIAVACIMCLPVSEPLWREAGLIRPVYFEASVFTSKVFVATLSTAAVAILAAFAAVMTRHRRLLWIAILTAGASFFMTVPYSRAVWDAVPQLAMLDFPWRFCTLLTFAAAVLTAIAVDVLLRSGSVHGRAAAGLFCLAVLTLSAGAAFLLDVPSRFVAATPVRETRGMEVLLRTYSRSNPPEWLKTHLDSVRALPLADASAGTVTVARTGPRKFELQVRIPEPATVRVRQLYYPAWRAADTAGGEFHVQATDPEGMIAIAVPAGNRKINLELTRTYAENAGLLLSIGALALTGVLLLRPRDMHAA